MSCDITLMSLSYVSNCDPGTHMRCIRFSTENRVWHPTRGIPMTSLRLAWEVSASHDKSGSDWRMGPDAQRKPTTRAPPPTRVEEWFPTPCKYNSWRLYKQLTPTRALMLAWPTERPSHRHHLHSATCKLSPRHSSTLYDTHEPGLRLGRGGLGKYSGRLRKAQTTQRRSQTSRNEQSCPATRRLPWQSTTTRLQCVMTDNDVRRDVPATKHCTFFTSPLCPSPCDYRRERRATVTRVRPSIDQTPPQGTWARRPLPTSL
jgi:hypothetical protein